MGGGICASPKMGHHCGKYRRDLSGTRIYLIRIETGESYLLFIDRVNQVIPVHNREKGFSSQPLTYVVNSRFRQDKILRERKEQPVVSPL